MHDSIAFPPLLPSKHCVKRHLEVNQRNNKEDENTFRIFSIKTLFLYFFYVDTHTVCVREAAI